MSHATVYSAHHALCGPLTLWVRPMASLYSLSQNVTRYTLCAQKFTIILDLTVLTLSLFDGTN